MKRLECALPDHIADLLIDIQKTCTMNIIGWVGCSSCKYEEECAVFHSRIATAPCTWEIAEVSPTIGNEATDGLRVCGRCHREFGVDWPSGIPQGAKIRRKSGTWEKTITLCPECASYLNSFMNGRALNNRYISPVAKERKEAKKRG